MINSDNRRKIVSKKYKTNTLDPVTALINLGVAININNHCNLKVLVFDGKRRYNIILKDLGEEVVLKNYIIKENTLSRKRPTDYPPE